MNRLQQLLHDKGALCHDIEAHTAAIAGFRERLGPITAEINKLLKAAAESAKPAAAEPVVLDATPA